MVSVTYTMTTPSRFGMMWRRMMSRFSTPQARAASTNSMFFRLSVCPRTMRAMSSQFTAPMATKISTMCRPNTTISRITKNMKGSA